MLNLFRLRDLTAALDSPPPSSTKKFTETEKKYLWHAALETIERLKAENELLRLKLADLSPRREANGRFTKK